MRYVVGSIIACCTVFYSCKEQPKQVLDSDYPIHTVGASNQVLISTYSATIRGKQDIDIYPEVSGKLTKVCVTEGEYVKQGQVLFIIDQVPFKSALATASANVITATAALATAQLNYNSKQELFNEQVVSEFDLKTAENELLMAQANLLQAEANEINARNNLSYTEIKSPSNGVIGMLPFRVGTLVSPSIPKPLTTVSDNSEMYVYFSLTEKQLLNLTRQYGSKNNILKNMPEIRLQLSDNSIYELTGKIESISGVIDRTTGTAGLRAVFPNPQGMLYSGTSGNILLPSNRTNCLTIPQSSTFEIQDQMFVYKVVEGKATTTQVTVTRINGGKEYIVESGLVTGDEIVAKGVGLIQEGTIVKQH